jgi:hypothetical protein
MQLVPDQNYALPAFMNTNVPVSPNHMKLAPPHSGFVNPFHDTFLPVEMPSVVHFHSDQ